jgi:flavin-dependent dehydrogenase
VIALTNAAYTEIVVAGAGPAGASIARLLAARGKRVTVVDPESHRTDRLEMLPPSAMPAIEALGLAPLVRDSSIARQCLGIRRCWHRETVETDDFLCHRGNLGFVVDRSTFDAALRGMAADAGVAFVSGRIAAAYLDSHEVVLRVATADAATFLLRTGIAIDATGRPAAIARRLGARRLLAERLVASCRRSVRTQDVDRQPTWLEVEAKQRCWSYRIVGPRGRCETWTVYRGDKRPLARSDGRVDASAARLSQAAGNRWLAVGDAAAAFDPIASQGLVTALAGAVVGGGAILSPEGLNRESAGIYSGTVATTFDNSEVGRKAVYRLL